MIRVLIEGRTARVARGLRLLDSVVVDSLAMALKRDVVVLDRVVRGGVRGLVAIDGRLGGNVRRAVVLGGDPDTGVTSGRCRCVVLREDLVRPVNGNLWALVVVDGVGLHGAVAAYLDPDPIGDGVGDVGV